MKPPRRDPLKPHITDIRKQLSFEQLAVIGAIALQFNNLEAHLDLLIGISLRLSPLSHHEVITRLGTIESRQDLAKIMARDLAISEKTQELIGKSIVAIGTLKKSRDAIVHVRLIDPSTSVGVYSGRIRNVGKMKEVILRPRENPKTSHPRNAAHIRIDSPADFRVLTWTEYILLKEDLDEIYLQMRMLDEELDVSGVIFTIHSMNRIKPNSSIEFRGETLAAWEVKLEQLQNNRLARRLVAITPKTLGDAR